MSRADEWLARLKLPDREQTRLLGNSAAMGVVGGLAAVAFDLLANGVGLLVLGTGEPSVASLHPARAVVGPVVTSLLAGWIIMRTTSARPLGIPDAIENVQTAAGDLNFRNSVLSAAAGLLAVGGGQSAGREGPIVQFASALARSVCLRMGIRPERAPSLVAAGAAAGIAASFNSPLGGAFFAMEVLLGSFAIEAFAPVVVASVVGTAVGQLLLGNRLALQLPPVRIDHLAELLVFPLLGIAAGVVTILLRTLVRHVNKELDRFVGATWYRPGVSGLFVGVLAALGLPHVMGNGYALFEGLIAMRLTLSIPMLSIILVAKLLATALAYSGRSGGGIFAPALFLGAITGALVEAVILQVAPALVPSPGLFATVGMGAVAAAVANSPVTVALMLAEMTGNYAVLLPLMLTIAIATVIAHAADRRSVFVQALHDRGVVLGEPVDLAAEVFVRDLASVEGAVVLGADAPFAEVARAFLGSRVRQVFVVRGTVFVGVIDLLDVRGDLQAAADPRTASELVCGVQSVRPEASIADAVTVFSSTDLEALPVVDFRGDFAGVLFERDVMGSIQQQRRPKAAQERRETFRLPDGYALSVLHAREVAGRRLGDLALGERFSITVLRVDHDVLGETTRHPPTASRVMTPSDRLLVMGPTDTLAQLAGKAPPVAPSKG